MDKDQNPQYNKIVFGLRHIFALKTHKQSFIQFYNVKEIRLHNAIYMYDHTALSEGQHIISLDSAQSIDAWQMNSSCNSRYCTDLSYQ